MKTTSPSAIEIHRFRDNDPSRAWRAIVRLPRKLGIHGGGINGAQTEGGPWVEGYGYSAEQALAEVYKIIGRAIVGMTEPPVEETAPEASS